MSLTEDQKWAIAADLSMIRQLGFRQVRFLTYVKANDPAYDLWPANYFFTFPSATQEEADSLREFFQMVDRAGLVYEAVLLMADSKEQYFNNGVTSDNYKAFIDSIWPALWAGKLRRLYLGGDLLLGGPSPLVENNRRWLSEMWPWFVDKCGPCSIGVELLTGGASFWDTGAASTAWIKDNLVRQPNYLGYQLYPTSKAALEALGFVHDGVVDWDGVALDWLTGLRQAAGPGIEVVADEIGLATGEYFDEMDQRAFLDSTLRTFNINHVDACVWEFADHPSIGNYGIFRQDRRPKRSVASIPQVLRGAGKLGLYPGIQYSPPEHNDLLWLIR